MDADERGLKVEIRPVEWKPSPDMYRMDTPEGREAYEASFRMKIVPAVGQRRAMEPVIGSDESAETRINMG